jgi:hypothetical protein
MQAIQTCGWTLLRAFNQLWYDHNSTFTAILNYLGAAIKAVVEVKRFSKGFKI